MSHKRFYAILTVSITILTSSFASEKPVFGSITGQVFDRQTKEPIPSANVVIVGTTAGAATDEKGQFTIAKVGLGQYQVRVTVLGYKSTIQTVTVDTRVAGADQSFPMDEDNITVGGVDVTAAQFKSAPDVPLSTRSFSARELQNTAGGLDDVVRAIKNLPGVAQTRADRTDLIVRGGAPPENLILLDNIEILFDVALKQDPLRLLQGLSRNKTIIASWNGSIDKDSLTYAVPGHPEYRRYSSRDLLIATPA